MKGKKETLDCIANFFTENARYPIRREIAEMLGVTTGCVSTRLERLKTMGLIEHYNSKIQSVLHIPTFAEKKTKINWHSMSILKKA
tara:strand:- start:346 stop:603 length:258 start_codon:yes stop_codon:yes gene_type:complete